MSVAHICWRITTCLADPQKAQFEMLLDQLERHLDIPPSRHRPFGHGWNRERMRVVNVGDIAAHGSALPESHQANGVLGTVSAVCSPATRWKIEYLAPLIEDVHHLVAGLCPQPAQPVIAPVRGQSNQAKPKYPRSCNQKCPCRHLRRQIPRHDLLVLLRVRLKPNGSPLLASHVERAG